MWAPAVSLFAADVASSTLADVTFNADSAVRYSGALQLRPLAEPLALHVRVAAAVISCCSRSCISLESFYDELW